MNKILIFSLNNNLFGIDIENIDYIINEYSITKIPNTPNFIEGLINLRGKIHTIVNIKYKLDMCIGEKKCIFEDITEEKVIFYRNKKIGFIVDSILSIEKYEHSDLEFISTNNFIIGTLKLKDQVIQILDFDKLLGA